MALWTSKPKVKESRVLYPLYSLIHYFVFWPQNLVSLTYDFAPKFEINTERNAEIDHEHEKHLAIIVEAKSHWYRSNGVEVVQHEFLHQRPCCRSNQAHLISTI